MADVATVPAGGGRTAPAKGAGYALALLLAINLFNYADRYILAAVLPKVAADPAIGPLSKAAQGRLATAFVVAYLAFSPLFGWLGDRVSRWLLVGIGVILWSLASGGSGLAAGYVMLLLTRCFVGIGEAVYGPVAPSVLSDLYPVERRGKVMAWFYMAIPLGSALGYLFGGMIASNEKLGWRWAFYLVVVPGLLLGLLCFLMREPPVGQADAAVPVRKPTFADYKLLAAIPSYVLNSIATTALCFAVGGVAYWMPTYVYEREAFYAWTDAGRDKLDTGPDRLPDDVLGRLDQALREADGTGRKFPTTHALDDHLASVLTPDDRQEFRRHRTRVLDVARDPDAPSLAHLNFVFSAILAVGGLTATLFGGWLGDKLRPRYPGAYSLVSGWTALAGVPLFLLVLYVPFPWAWGVLFAAVFCLFAYTGPSNTMLANVVPPAIRSTGFAVNILVIHLFGDAISPWIIGWVADAANLNVGFMVVTGVILLGGAAWIYGARFVERDTAAAPFLLGDRPAAPPANPPAGP
jgi:MFS family permease